MTPRVTRGGRSVEGRRRHHRGRLPEGRSARPVGGDEFAVLLPETLAADAEKVAARIHQVVASTPVVAKSLELNVTVSIGIADLNSGEIANPEAMISLADQALYAAKELGRNRIILAHDLGGTNLDPNAKEKQKVDVLCKKLAGLDSQFKGVFLQAVEEVVKVLEQRDSNMADHERSSTTRS